MTWHHLRIPDAGDGSRVPFVLTVIAVALLISYLRGGRLRRIARAPLERTWLLFAGVAVQVGVDLAAGRGLLADASFLGWLLLLGSQLLIVGFLLANWRLPGIPLVTLGLLLNAVVIAANGAMPVSPEAIAALGIEGAEVPPGKHTLMTEDTVLPWLADIWPLPLLRSIISIGDVVIAAGIIPLAHALMTYETPEERRASRT